MVVPVISGGFIELLPSKNVSVSDGYSRDVMIFTFASCMCILPLEDTHPPRAYCDWVGLLPEGPLSFSNSMYALTPAPPPAPAALRSRLTKLDNPLHILSTKIHIQCNKLENKCAKKMILAFASHLPHSPQPGHCPPSRSA